MRAVGRHPGVDVAADHAVDRRAGQLAQGLVRRVPAQRRTPGDAPALALEQPAHRVQQRARLGLVELERGRVDEARRGRPPDASAPASAGPRRRRRRSTPSRSGLPRRPRQAAVGAVQAERRGECALVRRRQASFRRRLRAASADSRASRRDRFGNCRSRSVCRQPSASVEANGIIRCIGGLSGAVLSPRPRAVRRCARHGPRPRHATPLPRIPRSIWALGFVSLLMDVSSEMIHSLLPVFMVDDARRQRADARADRRRGRGDGADRQGVLGRAVRLVRPPQAAGGARLRPGCAVQAAVRARHELGHGAVGAR